MPWQVQKGRPSAPPLEVGSRVWVWWDGTDDWSSDWYQGRVTKLLPEEQVEVGHLYMYVLYSFNIPMYTNTESEFLLPAAVQVDYPDEGKHELHR